MGWAQFLSEATPLLNLLIAMVLGGLIGWEREAAGKWAGFRTHMLVAVAAAAFIQLGVFLSEVWPSRVDDGVLQVDPMRLLEAIVTGIAFIGAGTIFRDRQEDMTRGLTTAAALFATAPIGVAVALGKYVFAAGATLLILIILRAIRAFEVRLGVGRERRRD